ncbi:class I histocompatibility antigen, F10 alpha chain-like [Periophthalmus magnuspinnatus]|uniref:class I histocompatibility antigen, F10 alpha chain-like n=1 Tax=Periophthalmus magnuspinnatus TaxID=409849 RepID=UPI002436DE46|nr:class I histocompatibility antigen, F10 alpha chain-like [Periophthalmus magnuspinnatus]
MRDNLVFTGIPEQPTEDAEKLVKDFITTQLKLPAATVNAITFHRVHRMGPKNTKPDNKRPKPIVAKFEHYKQKQQIIHYDSDTKKLVPKQEWMNKLTEEDPRSLNPLKDYLKLYGCEWDNETSEIRGYEQHSFDGEDFISLDFDPETFVAPKQQAFITKLIWERDGEAVRVKHYIIHECAEYLKKYVHHGESALNRIELPLVSLLQKSSSAPVTCHATGFYPDRAMLFWTKDGDELLEDVELGEILPDRDGTFQTSVSLDLSSVPPEDWDRYHCAFQLSGDKNKYLTRLDRCMIRNNEELHSSHLSCVGCSRCCSHCCCPCCGHLHLVQEM